MWIHIVIFIAVLATVILWKIGWLPEVKSIDKESKRIFVVVALAGNVLGMLVTMDGGIPTIYENGHKLVKEETGSYEEEFTVTVDGGESRSFYVQVPSKETEQEEQLEEEVLTEEEQLEKTLREEIALYNEEINDPEYYYLPAKVDGKKLEWGTPADHTGSFLAALGLFAAVVIILKKERELQEQAIKRSEQLLLDYPGVIMKFTLLVQAGMTVRKAFQKMALDYKRKVPEKSRYAYEEIIVTCNEMESGISEMEAYRRFGERCAQIKYKTFATLLIQNLQKGSKRLSDMLEKESLEAWDERKRKARVLGETAATKLLVPMIMMMTVVMAIIMIPAFLAFYA